MVVNDVINLAKTTELSRYAFKDNVDTIISLINLGMIELYKVFALETSEHIINLETGVTIYTLPSDYMYMVSAYEEVPLNADEYVVPVPINEENNPYSINTISSTQVQIPLTITGSYISIIYVPKPTPLTSANLNDELNLPDGLISALLAFLADRADSSVQEIALPDATASYYVRFERACEKARMQGVAITPDDFTMPTRIHDRGFV